MTQHTDLIERLRLLAADMDEERRPTSSSVADAAADALEAQAREIDELKAQEAELCTLYGLAQAECKKLRKNAERWRWATEQAEFFSMVVDGTGLHCAEVYEAESAVDAAIAMKGQP